MYPRSGGTAAIDVSGVAEAIAAASFNGESGRCYPIGWPNQLELLGTNKPNDGSHG